MSAPGIGCSTGKYCSPNSSSTWTMGAQNFIEWNRFYTPFAVQKMVDVYVYDTYNTREPVAKFINIENGTGTLGVTPDSSWFINAPPNVQETRSFVFVVTPNGTPPDIPDSEPFSIIGINSPNPPPLISAPSTPTPTPTTSNTIATTSSAFLTPTSTQNTETLVSSNTITSTDSAFTSVATVSFTPPASTITTTEENGDSGLSTSSKVLIAVFSSLFLILLILFMMIVTLRRRRNKKAQSEKDMYNQNLNQPGEISSSLDSGFPLIVNNKGLHSSASDSRIDETRKSYLESSSVHRNRSKYLMNPVIMDSPRAVIPGIHYSTRTDSTSSLSHFSSVPDLSLPVNRTTNSEDPLSSKPGPINHLQNIDVDLIQQGFRNALSRAPRDPHEYDNGDNIRLEPYDNGNDGDNSLENNETWRENIALDRLTRALAEERSVLHSAEQRSLGTFSNPNVKPSSSADHPDNNDHLL